MCGISGYIGRQKINNQKIKKLQSQMKNRGPDNFGSKIHLQNNLNVYLFHSRLNILDLSSKANQPFIIGNYIIIFNGEIYNFKALKIILQKKGYNFKTSSDTEVLLNLYIHYKEKCVQFLEGMWSFCVWDMERRIFFLSRDIFGEKPLFFLSKKNGFYFGSQTNYIETLLGKNLEINKSLIKKNLIYGFKSIHKTNETYFKDVFSLNPGENITVDYGLNLKFKKYWKFRVSQNKENKNLSEYIIKKRVQDLITNSVKEKIVSDVPVAISLSSGLDSSVLLSILKKKLKINIEAFSLIDKGVYNEKKLIEKNVKKLGVKCNYVKIDYSNFFENLKKIIKYQNQPISTITYFAQNQLMKLVAKKKYKVILSGTGADEIFAGYLDHYRQLLSSINKNKRKDYLFYWNKYYLSKIRNKELKDPLVYTNKNINNYFIYGYDKQINSYIKFKYKYNISENFFSINLLRNRMLNELFYEITPVTLRHEDLNCMQHSIENRSPFLDINIFNFMSKVPFTKLIQHGYLKFLLRNSFKKLLIKDIYENREKIGFNASLKFFLENESKTKLKFFFLKDKVMKKFVDMKKIYYLAKDEKRNACLDKFLFNVINIKIFLENRNG